MKKTIIFLLLTVFLGLEASNSIKETDVTVARFNLDYSIDLCTGYIGFLSKKQSLSKEDQGVLDSFIKEVTNTKSVTDVSLEKKVDDQNLVKEYLADLNKILKDLNKSKTDLDQLHTSFKKDLISLNNKSIDPKNIILFAQQMRSNTAAIKNICVKNQDTKKIKITVPQTIKYQLCSLDSSDNIIKIEVPRQTEASCGYHTIVNAQLMREYLSIPDIQKEAFKKSHLENSSLRYEKFGTILSPWRKPIVDKRKKDINKAFIRNLLFRKMKDVNFVLTKPIGNISSWELSLCVKRSFAYFNNEDTTRNSIINKFTEVAASLLNDTKNQKIIYLTNIMTALKQQIIKINGSDVNISEKMIGDYFEFPQNLVITITDDYILEGDDISSNKLVCFYVLGEQEKLGNSVSNNQIIGLKEKTLINDMSYSDNMGLWLFQEEISNLFNKEFRSQENSTILGLVDNDFVADGEYRDKLENLKKQLLDNNSQFIYQIALSLPRINHWVAVVINKVSGHRPQFLWADSLSLAGTDDIKRLVELLMPAEKPSSSQSSSSYCILM